MALTDAPARSDHATVRVVEALAFSVLLYAVVFAATYYLMAHAQESDFDGALTITESKISRS